MNESNKRKRHKRNCETMQLLETIWYVWQQFKLFEEESPLQPHQSWYLSEQASVPRLEIHEFVVFCFHGCSGIYSYGSLWQTLL